MNIVCFWGVETTTYLVVLILFEAVTRYYLLFLHCIREMNQFSMVVVGVGGRSRALQNQFHQKMLTGFITQFTQLSL